MGVSVRTGYKWWRRFCEHGLAGLQERSSRRTRYRTKRAPRRSELVLRPRRCRLTARQIATKLRMPRSTVSALLKRHRAGRLLDLQRPQPVVRYELHLLHLDVKNLGRILGIGYRITSDTRLLVGQAGSTFMSPSTTTLAWLTLKCSRTKRRRPPLPS